jgi:hypothetical protein
MNAPEQVKQQFAAWTTKQKVVAGCIAGGIFFALSLCVCSGATWFIAADFGAARERERIATVQQKAAEDVNKIAENVFKKGGGVEFFEAGKTKNKSMEWLTPDKGIVLDGIKFELLDGSTGKLRVKSDFGINTYLTDETFIQIRIRVTNNKPNFVLEYYGWDAGGFGLDRVALLDEHDNHYRQSAHRQIVGQPDFKKRRIEPGDSVEDILAFTLPLATSKEFRLELDAHPLKREGTIAYKIPRSFFEKKAAH